MALGSIVMRDSSSSLLLVPISLLFVPAIYWMATNRPNGFKLAGFLNLVLIIFSMGEPVHDRPQPSGYILMGALVYAGWVAAKKIQRINQFLGKAT